MTERNIKITMLAICLLALVLRLPGLLWGVLSFEPPKFVSYIRDEIQMSKLASEFSSGIVFSDQQYYPKGYPFQLALISFIVKPFAEIDFPELTMSGRALSVVYGVLTVALIFVIVKEVTSNSTLALFSSLWLAVSGLHVTRSHFAMPDAAVTFWIYMLMYCAFLYLRTKRRAHFIFAVISCGIALAVKLPFIAVIPIIYICAKEKLNWRIILLVLSALFVIFFVGNGGKYVWSTFVNTISNVLDDNINERQFNKWLNLFSYLIILIAALGLPVFLLALNGAWQAMRSKIKLNFAFRDIFFVVLLPLLLHFISICVISYPAGRHILPIIPFLCVLAAMGTLHIRKMRFFKNSRAFASLLSAIVIYQLIFVASLVYNCVVDTRQLATPWIQENIPHGETVALPKYSYLPPIENNYKAVSMSQANYLILHEAYYARYHKSIINPFKPFPKFEEIGNAELEDFHVIQNIFQGKPGYTLIQEFKIKLFTPELIFLKKVFGNLWDGCWGDVLIYQKESAKGAGYEL